MTFVGNEIYNVGSLFASPNFRVYEQVYFRIYSHNVFVDRARNVKLGNFGRSRSTEDVTTSLDYDLSSIRWLCPEKVKNNELAYSMEADVYRYEVNYQTRQDTERGGDV